MGTQSDAETNEMLEAFGKCAEVFLKGEVAEDSPDAKIAEAFSVLYQSIAEAAPPPIKTRAAVIFAQKMVNLPEGAFIGPAPLILGSLVEAGGNADEVGPIYTEYLKKFTNFFIRELPPDEDEREEFQPWLQLAGFAGQGAAAIYCRSKQALIAAQKETELIRRVVKMRWEARFLHHVLVAPNDMEIYVFCLTGDSKFGCKAKINGISDNVQLNVLMEDAFATAHRAGCNPISAHVKAVFDGTGPQQTHLTYSPKFQLSCWTALQEDHSIPGGLSGMTHWIWGEGVPDDITPCPSLDGARVILLGDTMISRSNNVCREFGPLRASFEVLKFFDGEECTALLEKIAKIDPKVREETLAAEHERTNVKSMS
eukprot:Phypoly_transcript_09782.p1 GENE.Phypoly_transcript_09782~~Phypoly_transcript_09782.p1  ORF type:complete len:369 (+),score=60.80 Phypoly_transcript_09782:215-1321(+)